MSYGPDINVNKNTMLFLDTATRYTGYAVFTKGSAVATKEPYYMLMGYGNIRANPKADWESRCLEISSKVSKLISMIRPGTLCMEYPTFQGGAKGTAAARSGGTLELAYLCGRIAVCYELHITQIAANGGEWLPLAKLIWYGQWAGQTNKEITCRRLHDKLGIVAKPDSVDNNWADAIMMGRWYIEDTMKCKVLASDAKEVHL